MAALRVGIIFVVASFVLSLGLRSARFEPGYFWRRPALLLRSVAAVYVLVPLAVVGVMVLVHLPFSVELGVLLLAISPTAPLAPGLSPKLGSDLVYAYHLQVTIAILTVIALPATCLLVGSVFGYSLRPEVPAVTRTILLGQIIPLAVGFTLHRFFPRPSQRVGRILGIAAQVALVLVVLAVLFLRGRAIVALGVPALVTIIGIALLALGIGHLLGGPRPEIRHALAVASSSRHPGLAMLLAAINFPGQDVFAPVVAYLLATILVTQSYRFIVGGRSGKTATVAAPS